MAGIFIVEPFFGGSHRAFAEGLAAHSRHETTIISLPGRNWKWRMRGGAPLLAERAKEAGGKPDVLFASSMLNLAEFRGLAGRDLSQLPSILYFHENQLTYPLPDSEKRDLHFAVTQITSILAADFIVFNSRYHRREFTAALPALLAALPDHKPRGVERKLAERSGVLYPGLSCPAAGGEAPTAKGGEGGRKTILWNHRWEHDKGPDILLALVRRLREEQLPFELIVTGAGKNERADVFAELPAVAGDRLAHIGFVDGRGDYDQLLARADIVLSTARHEFFGISVLEAMLAGAFPLLPRKLSYPELLDPERYRSSYYDNFEELVRMTAGLLRGGKMPENKALRLEAERYCWDRVIAGFDDLIGEIAAPC